MDKGYKYLQQQFDLNTESSRVTEKVLNNKVKKVYSTSDIQRRYLSIVVSDEFVETTVKTIMETARTGNVGDGKIFVCPVEEAYRIRTGENGYEGIN